MTTNVDEQSETVPPEAPQPQGGAPTRAGFMAPPRRTSSRASLLPIAWVLVIIGFGICTVPARSSQWSNFANIFGAQRGGVRAGDGAAGAAHQRRPRPVGGMSSRASSRVLVAWLNVNITSGDRPGDPRRRRRGHALRRDQRRDHRHASTSTRSSSRSRPAPCSTASPSGCRTSRRSPASRRSSPSGPFSRHIFRIPMEFWYGHRDHADHVVRAHVHAVRADARCSSASRVRSRA